MKKLGPPYARPELRGRYLIRDPLKASAMAGVDLILSAMPRRRKQLPHPPRRVLFCNWAHLGDVVLTFPAIARLRNALPEAKFGFLAQSAARDAADAIPGLDRVHILDHWQLNRSPKSIAEKRELYLRQRDAVVAEISASGYDLAIDFYQHYPTAAFELWRADIPVRIGYSSGGLAPLLTASVDWTIDDRHVIERHGDIVDLALGSSRPSPPLTAAYSQPSAEAMDALKRLGAPDAYILIHTGAGGLHKEWPEERWAEVVGALAARGEPVVLAGAGSRDLARNARLALTSPAVVDLTDALTWPNFLALVANARILIGLDSVAAHLGAAYGVRTICIRSGTVSANVWGPLNSRVVKLTAPTTCSPCHRLGCDHMDCLMGVSAAAVLGELDKMVQPARAGA